MKQLIKEILLIFSYLVQNKIGILTKLTLIIVHPLRIIFKKMLKPINKTSFMDIKKIINELKIKNENETSFTSIEATP